MNRLSAPVPGESLAEAGERIRDAVPIRGVQATNAECRDRRELIDDTLASRGVGPGVRLWYTAQLVDGHIAGVWAQSAAEAELGLTVWWGARCHWVKPDPDARLRDEYLPRGKRSPADQAFPLAPPRQVRDQFADAGSLLDGLLPSSSTDRPRR